MSKRSVFLSYSARDRAAADQLQKELKRLGLNAFNPMNDLKPGEDFRKTIRAAIKGSDLLVVLASPLSAASSWMGYEVGMAEALGKRVMFLLPERYPVTELPDEFSEGPILEFDPQAPKRAAREIADRLVTS